MSKHSVWSRESRILVKDDLSRDWILLLGMFLVNDLEKKLQKFKRLIMKRSQTLHHMQACISDIMKKWGTVSSRKHLVDLLFHPLLIILINQHYVIKFLSQANDFHISVLP